MENKIPVVPDPETVNPPIMPTMPAPLPIPMPHPQQVKPDDGKDEHRKK